MNRVEVICPNCRAAYVIHRQFVGRYAKCKKCGQSFLAAESDLSGEMRLEDLASLAEPSQDDVRDTDEPISISTPPPLPPAPRMPAVALAVSVAPARVRSSVNFDWIAPTLLLMFLGLMVLIGLHLTVAEIPFFARPKAPIPGRGQVWLTLFLRVVAFFCFVAPAAWGGVMLAAKLGREDPGYSSYLRSASIASIPLLLFGAIAAIQPTFGREAVILGVVLLLPLIYVALMLIFDFEAIWTFVAFVFAAIFFLPAVYISNGVVNWTMRAIRGDLAPAAILAPAASGGDVSSSAAVNPVLPESPVVSLRRRLEAFDAEDFSNRSRETLETRFATYRRDVESMKRSAPNDPEWPSVDAVVTSIETKIGSAVSSKPDESIFVPLQPTQAWATTQNSPSLESPVSFRDYQVSPPAGAKLNLRSSEEGPTGLIWAGTAGQIAFMIEPVGNSRQQRPWIMNKPFMREEADRQKLLAFDGRDARAESGRIGDFAFTRIIQTVAGSRSTRYIARENDHWLIIEFTARTDDGKGLESLEASARSIRRTPKSTAKIDPFSPDRIAPRLNDDAENASRILIQHGKAAEDAVLEVLKNGSHLAKRAAVEVLAKIGTEKSLELLTVAARSNDSTLAEAAKMAMHKISPAEVDAVAVAMIDLDATSPFKRADAYKVLAAAKSDERREEISSKLEMLLLGEKVFMSEYDDLSAALAVWARKETVANLLPLLDEEHGNASRRRAAMMVLGKIGDPRAAYPIARWLILDTPTASAALVNIGPAAEDEVVKLLRDKNPVARREAARILEKIGGNKSLPELYRASNDPRDKPAADAAKQALASVRLREKEKQTPATQGGK